MPKLINRLEAAQRIGVHPRTIDRMREDGRLTTHRSGVGRTIMIDQTELDALIQFQPTY